MIPVSDIIVLDFCEWLKHKIDKNKAIAGSLLKNIEEENNRWLTRYANQYIAELPEKGKEQYNCPDYVLLKEFIVSNECQKIVNACNSYTCRDRYNNCNSTQLLCRPMYKALQSFKEARKEDCYSTEDLSAERLAYSAKRVLLFGDHQWDKNSQPPQIMQLMTSVSGGVAEELSFVQWLASNCKEAKDIQKMPADFIDGCIDRYIEENGLDNKEKKRLQKELKNTGWNGILNKIRVFLQMRNRNEIALTELIERYCSEEKRYKCVILPYSDIKSQEVYKKLIRESWADLNYCSGEKLDIIYSETDTGKSGFKTASQLKGLPQDLEIPCIAIWEQSISDAVSVSISNLDNQQIVGLIECIVKGISKEKEFRQIISEAREKVEKLIKESKPNTNYNTINVNGNGNVVGDNNVSSVNISGHSEVSVNDSFNQMTDEGLIDLCKELETAIKIVTESKELNKEQKEILVDALKTGKDGVEEKTEEKQKKAKIEFGTIIKIICKNVPTLISTFLNLTKLAEFFDLKSLIH